MGSNLSQLKGYVAIVFLLLGALFGSMILSLAFGTLSNASSDLLDDETLTITNRSLVYINTTTYTIPEASYLSFNGGFTVIAAVNASSGAVIAAGNYTANSAAGTLRNASAVQWGSVNMTYSYTSKTSAKLGTEGVANDSLNAVKTYSSGASTQMSTVTIAIVMVLLIGIFVIFWNLFIGGKKKSNKMEIGGNFA